MKENRFLIFICAAALTVIPCWIYFVVPQFEKIPQDFSYGADIFSLDNFYDEESHQYLGEQISKTRFTYKVVPNKDDIFEIKNVFDVRQITGEKIFSVERTCGIDVLTGKHVKGYGDKDRTGYLFAPKHLKKQDYVYWRINYGEPALLKFQQKEVIDGLKVYRYETDYHADQTDNLGFLAGVPEKRGVNLDINLQVWIEPVSGWMVKYEDNTTAYYYDIKTKERLHPWNKFSNKYTDTSITLQVENAKRKKLKYIILKRVAPVCFGALMLILLWFYKFRISAVGGKMGEEIYVDGKGVHPLLLLLLCLLTAGYFFIKTVSQKNMVKIGISDWVPDTLFEENIKGFKDALEEAGYKEGEDIQYLYQTPNANKEKQREVIKAFVEEGVDLIYTLTTPGTLVAKSITADIPIVFSVVTYPVEANIIGSLLSSGNNLVGTRNYVPAHRQYYFFERIYPNTKILGFVHRKGEPNSVIQYREFNEMMAKRGIAVVDIAAIDLDDMRSKISASIDQIDSLFAACDTLIQAGGEDIVIEFSKKYKKPSFSCNLDGVVKGTLIGNVTDLYTIGKMSGEKAVEILKGAQPQWLSTEAPLVDHIIVNTKTAKILNLNIPQDVLSKAARIIDQ